MIDDHGRRSCAREWGYIYMLSAGNLLRSGDIRGYQSVVAVINVQSTQIYLINLIILE